MHNGVHIRVEGLVLEKLLDRAVESGISFLSIARRSPHDMELWLDDRERAAFSRVGRALFLSGGGAGEARL